MLERNEHRRPYKPLIRPADERPEPPGPVTVYHFLRGRLAALNCGRPMPRNGRVAPSVHAPRNGGQHVQV